ncbi:MAG: hypothetical protein IBX55_00835 [Methyloprofundus sp.]|nr:hypothetical protein [Methyloprofundus sp.]
MIIAITGHADIELALGVDKRYPEGEKYNREVFDRVYKDIEKGLSEYLGNQGLSLNDATFVSGMARGVDEVFAIMAIRHNLPLILSIPNSVKWHKDRPLRKGVRGQAVYYEKILSYDRIIEIYEINRLYNDIAYVYANFARNQHMIDISDTVFSYKVIPSPGTNDGILRAEKAGKYAGNLFNPPGMKDQEEFSGFGFKNG